MRKIVSAKFKLLQLRLISAVTLFFFLIPGVTALSAEIEFEDFNIDPIVYELSGPLAVMVLSGGMALHYGNQNDLIEAEDQYVERDAELFIFAELLRKNNLIYQDLPLFSETRYVRLTRLINEGKWYELNPLIKHPFYMRTNYTTSNYELASQTVMHSIFQMTYRAYHFDYKTNKNAMLSFGEMALAPFQPRYILDWKFWAPLVVIGALTTLPEVNYPIMVSPGMKSGYSAFYTTAISFNAGVGEEAFFRGTLHHALLQKMSPVQAGLLSGTAFGLAHLPGGSPGQVLLTTLGGFYFAYLFHANQGDIRQGIAVHFWWDIIAIAAMVRNWHESSNVNKSKEEIHYMPLYYQLKF